MPESKPSDKQSLREAALEYHRLPFSGKISVRPTKPLTNQHDLSLAYSPGVAFPCLEIQADPGTAAEYTSRGNLVGVITNGTAVLGLGDIGPLAGKPVMEGKGCLFRKFAGVDVFDIELDERDPDKLVEIIAALEPTLGGVNLEDIKAPECFYIERQLRERMNIPVFHDDQHGTAIISAAALINALEIVGKKIDSIKLAVSGAGAAALACVDLMMHLGVRHENIFMCDSKGVIYKGRPGVMDESKTRYAQDTDARTLADIMRDADVFLGCSAAGVLTPEMLKTMAESPVILALANPEPEIRPEIARAARPDCIIATGRSDYPNQVNNVLCFPYIFRGALDCGATRITEEMKLACVREIAALARAEVSTEVAAAYPDKELVFGPEYFIPAPFDGRLILRIAPAVAHAAEESGVATRPIVDLAAYRDSLVRFVYQTGITMRPVFSSARSQLRRVVYAEGEHETVLRAAQTVVDEKLARPILIGHPPVIEARIRKAALRLQIGRDVEVVNPDNDPRLHTWIESYRKLMGRRGVDPESAHVTVSRSNTLVAALMMRQKDADAMLCGMLGRFDSHMERIHDVIGMAEHAPAYATLNAVMLEKYTLFIADTYVNENPDAQTLASIALMACHEVRRFGREPKVAFLSHSGFGSSRRTSALKMRQAAEIFRHMAPDVESEGELRGDMALAENVRDIALPGNSLRGAANILICPNLDAANILLNVLKIVSGHGITVGPILMGTAAPAHILIPQCTVRRIVNMTALAASSANVTG